MKQASRDEVLKRFREVAAEERREEEPFVFVDCDFKSSHHIDDSAPSSTRKLAAENGDEVPTWFQLHTDIHRNNILVNRTLPVKALKDFKEANLRYQFGDTVVRLTVVTVKCMFVDHDR